MSTSTSVEAVPFLARTPEEWEADAKRLGGRPFNGRQIFRWIHVRGVTNPLEMTDLPAKVRERLAEEGLADPIHAQTVRRSTDGTRKLLVGVRGDANVETVLIPGVTGARGRMPSPLDGGQTEVDADAADMLDEGEGEAEEEAAGTAPDERVRVSQCISTQVGCAMGCVFCASGVAGLKRHLDAGEIVGQVILGRRHLDADERLSNVVYMGMGEPLNNYENTLRSLRLLSHRDGIALSTRRITVSTSGLVPEIAKLGEDFKGNIGLAISLHAVTDERRSALMPINRKYPLAELMAALRKYPLPRRRRITIEYTLVAGQNDTPSEAKALARLLAGLPVKVNLIPMNPIAASTLGPPPMRGVLEFQKVLVDAGYSCFIRRRRGDDVDAACGQLALLGAKPKVKRAVGAVE
jgi:23S rRNA (adenine2503-C2)-methyltransferase